MSKERVFVFGIDGGTFDIIRPAVEAGRLPNLARLLEEGCHGPLRSTIPPLTPMAWTSFATGVNAGRHGIYDFSRFEDGHLKLSTALDRRVPALWTHLTRSGRDAVVVNVPFTYPAEHIRGIMIPGFDTPKVEREVFWPHEVYDELIGRFGKYRFDWTFPIGQKFAPEEYLRDIEEVVAHRGETGRYLMQNHPWDFFMTVFTSTDHVQHVFWGLPDGREQVERVYRAVDVELGKFLEILPDDVNVVVMSDHGAGSIRKIFYLDNWLAREGYLTRPRSQMRRSLLKRAKSSAKRLLPVSMRKWLRARFPDLRNRVEGMIHEATVDWAETRAFGIGMYGNIRINLKGREPDGIVDPSEYDDLLAEISAKLMELADPDTGEKIIERVYRSDELYEGPNRDPAPDLVIHWRDYAYFTKKGVDQGDDIFGDYLNIDSSEYPHSGTHRLDGVFIGRGPSFVEGVELEADIRDLAPTLLYLLDEPLPEGLEGRVLEEALSDELLRKRPPGEGQGGPGGSMEMDGEISLSEKEENAVRERLKSLGYI